VTYSFHFGDIWAAREQLLWGTLLTLELSAGAMVLSLFVAVFGALARTSGPRWLQWLVAAYVEFIRNTPFLIQLFFIFFGLPSLGIQLSEMQGAMLAMIINLGAYSCEIVRAGIQATTNGQFEAGWSLGMTRFETFRHVVLIPALQRIWPALSSQIVLVMLGSAVVSQIAAEDLSFAANFIQSRNFRAFEIYFVVTAIYLLLAIALRQVLRGIGWWLFPRKATR
jgi:polar amino acid transport system permease protein